MAHNMLVRLHAEYKPVLSVLNVVLDLSNCVNDEQVDDGSGDSDSKAFIDVEADVISFRKRQSQIKFRLDGLEMYPTSCRGLRWSVASELHLSLHTRNTGESQENGVLHNAKVDHSVQDAIVNRIQECQNRCYCVGCGLCVFNTNSEFKRVLPLPSENWSDFADIWFCHNHHHGDKAEDIPVSETTQTHTAAQPGGKSKGLTPRPDDCLVSSLYMLVNGKHVSQETVGITPVTKRLVCQRCGNFLGFVKGDDANSEDHSETQREGVYKIYLHAVKFGSPEGGGDQSCPLRSEIPHRRSDGVSGGLVEDFLCQLLCDQSRQYTSFRFLVQSSHEEHSDNLPIVLLIWLLDQNLQVFSSEQSVSPKSSKCVTNVTARRVMKVLYKGRFVDSKLADLHDTKNDIFKTWERDNSVHGLDLPYPLCKQLLSLLISSTKQLPISQRSLNSFHVGYLHHR